MNLKKYFWSLKPQALKETKKILKDPQQPKFTERAYNLLSRCDNPKEVFSIEKVDKIAPFAIISPDNQK